MVCKGKKPDGGRGRTLLGEEGEYGAQVTFASSSIRLYSPPLPVSQIQRHTKKDISSSAQPYYKLDWDTYGRILMEVVSGRDQAETTEGGFIAG